MFNVYLEDLLSLRWYLQLTVSHIGLKTEIDIIAMQPSLSILPNTTRKEHIDANGYGNVGGVSFYKDVHAARIFELLTMPCKLQLNDLCLLFLYQITTSFSIFVSHLIYFITCIVLMKLRNK